MFVPEFGHIPVVLDETKFNEDILVTYTDIIKYNGEFYAMGRWTSVVIDVNYPPQEKFEFDPWL